MGVGRVRFLGGIGRVGQAKKVLRRMTVWKMIFLAGPSSVVLVTTGHAKTPVIFKIAYPYPVGYSRVFLLRTLPASCP